MNIYEGNENYIFISYAHSDIDRVLPILEDLDKEGFRIWFDRGIEAGSEWTECVEEHLKECYLMIYFISENSIESSNCRDEVNLARSEKKRIIQVYLEDVELKHGLALRLSSYQAIYRSMIEDYRQFIKVLIKKDILQPCKIFANTESEYSDISGTDAEINLGYMNTRGDECYDKKDYEQAVYWYRKAAEQGDARAQNFLGLCYADGEGLVQDHIQAVYWFLKAANQGYARAQYNLGLCYEYGDGVDKDYANAVSWYQKAAEQNNLNAKERLKQMKKRRLI